MRGRLTGAGGWTPSEDDDDDTQSNVVVVVGDAVVCSAGRSAAIFLSVDFSSIFPKKVPKKHSLSRQGPPLFLVIVTRSSSRGLPERFFVDFFPTCSRSAVLPPAVVLPTRKFSTQTNFSQPALHSSFSYFRLFTASRSGVTHLRCTFFPRQRTFYFSLSCFEHAHTHTCKHISCIHARPMS